MAEEEDKKERKDEPKLGHLPNYEFGLSSGEGKSESESGKSAGNKQIDDSAHAEATASDAGKTDDAELKGTAEAAGESVGELASEETSRTAGKAAAEETSGTAAQTAGEAASEAAAQPVESQESGQASEHVQSGEPKSDENGTHEAKSSEPAQAIEAAAEPVPGGKTAKSKDAAVSESLPSSNTGTSEASPPSTTSSSEAARTGTAPALEEAARPNEPMRSLYVLSEKGTDAAAPGMVSLTDGPSTTITADKAQGPEASSLAASDVAMRNALQPAASASAPSTVPSETELVPIETALGSGWNLMNHQLGLLMAISIVVGVMLLISPIVETIIPEIVKRNGFLSFCLKVFPAVFLLMYQIGRIKVTVRLIRGQEFDSDDFVNANARIFHYLLLLIIKSIILTPSFIFFVIPYFIMSARLDFADYLVIDQKQNAFSAIGNSWRITKGATLMLIVFGITCSFIEVIGLSVLIVGRVPARWMTDFARAFIYDRLLNKSKQTSLQAQSN